MKIIIDIPIDDYNNIEPFLNGETIKGGFNLFKVLEMINNGTPLDEMKNGEVLKAVFPNIDFCRKEFDGSMWVDMEDIASFRLDWWNSPYEPQESE